MEIISRARVPSDKLYPFIMAKICNKIVWIGNDPPPPPVRNFSENSSVLEWGSFPKLCMFYKKVLKGDFGAPIILIVLLYYKGSIFIQESLLTCCFLFGIEKIHSSIKN